MPRVAGLIIGHEILTGTFADANGPFLIRRLRSLGAELSRLVVLEDDVQAIAEEVARCSKEFDAVITTGGVGPTHDDVTLEGVARGLDRDLVRNEAIVTLMQELGVAIDGATLRMAHLPKGSVLEYSDESRFPVVRCENVWVFPGVPRMFRAKFSTIEQHFRGPAIHGARITLHTHETTIAAELITIAHDHPTVTIGSYPRFEEVRPTVIITLESTNAAALEDAQHALMCAFSSRLATSN